MKQIYLIILFALTNTLQAQADAELKEMGETKEWLNTVFEVQKIENDTVSISYHINEFRDTKLSGVTLIGTKNSEINGVEETQMFLIDLAEISELYFKPNPSNPKISDLVIEAKDDGQKFILYQDDEFYKSNIYTLNFYDLKDSLIERMVKAFGHLIAQNKIYYDKKQKF